MARHIPELDELLAEGVITLQILPNAPGMGDVFRVDAVTTEDNQRIGYVRASWMTARDLGNDCLEDVRALRDRHWRALGSVEGGPLDDVRLLHVSGAGVKPEWQRRGIATGLYAEAIREAGRRGAILVADACSEAGSGTTSEAARRLWQSSRLFEQPGVDVEGLSGYGPPVGDNRSALEADLQARIARAARGIVGR